MFKLKKSEDQPKRQQLHPNNNINNYQQNILIPTINTQPNLHHHHRNIRPMSSRKKTIDSVIQSNKNHMIPIDSYNNNRPTTTTTISKQKSRLMDRTGKGKLSSKFNQSNNNLIKRYTENQEEKNLTNKQQYISNEKAINIIEETIRAIKSQNEVVTGQNLQQQQKWLRLTQKLISNSSIIILKWRKHIQNQSATTTNYSLQKYNNNDISTFEDLVQRQIKHNILKDNTLIKSQFSCCKSESRIEDMIEKRLERLGKMLTVM